MEEGRGPVCASDGGRGLRSTPTRPHNENRNREGNGRLGASNHIGIGTTRSPGSSPPMVVDWEHASPIPPGAEPGSQRAGRPVAVVLWDRNPSPHCSVRHRGNEITLSEDGRMSGDLGRSPSVAEGRSSWVLSSRRRYCLVFGGEFNICKESTGESGLTR